MHTHDPDNGSTLLDSRFYSNGDVLRNVFGIGGVQVGVSGKRKTDITPASPLSLFWSAKRDVDIDIQVQWVANIPQTKGYQRFDSGTTWRLYESGSGFRFDFNSSDMPRNEPYKSLFIDTGFSRASLQMSGSCFKRLTDTDPFAYPLDELLIMHRLTQERAIELHGTGIVRANGVANLFVGHSGAGKSTTTRLWTAREEVEVLSDDRIIVRYDDGRDGPAGPTQMRMYGTPWHGEAMFASPNSAPLSRIFVLEHGHGNVITRLSRSEAVGELFARAFVPFHRHEYIDNALSFLEQLADSVPVYRYDFEPGERAIEKIQQFND